MPSTATQDLLKKINYIEVDVEIQKQILFSIPSDQTDEIEKTIKLIAEKNKEIEDLREKIKSVDPEEYERIMVFENAINSFRELASTHEFESIVSREMGGECVLEVKDGPAVECLIKANDANGNWTIITLEGEIQQYTKNQVSEIPPEKTEETIPFN
ncbi:hypothetical protein [Desulforhopalus sp. 52FAK]